MYSFIGGEPEENSGETPPVAPRCRVQGGLPRGATAIPQGAGVSANKVIYNLGIYVLIRSFIMHLCIYSVT